MKCKRTSLHVEHEAPGGVRPGEGDGAVGALGLGDAVLQRALIERVGGELTEAGVHAVLHLHARTSPLLLLLCFYSHCQSPNIWNMS